MNDIAVPEQFRTCVIASVRDAPEHVAGLAVALQRHLSLRVTVVVYTPRLLLAPFPRFVGPAGGLGVGAAIAEDREAEGAQEQLHNIEQAMQLAFPENQKTDVTCATGSPYRLAARLCEAFDLLVMPHRLGAVGVLRLWFADFDLAAALARPAPTLFCKEPPSWGRIIITQTADEPSWWASRILPFIGMRLNIPVNQWRPVKGRSGDAPLAPSSHLEPIAPAHLPEADQRRSCLVVSSRVIRRIRRFRAVHRLLRRWQGSCLVWS